MSRTKSKQSISILSKSTVKRIGTREWKGPGMAADFELTHCFPMLSVPDVTLAKQFYRDKLGFSIVDDWDYGEPPIYGGVMLDGTIFHFAEGEPAPNGVQIIVYVKNISAYFEELKRRGVETEGEPISTDYGQTQFGTKDCNGYEICFTETTANENE